MDQQSLYDRLGGGAAITAVVDDFVARCAGDTRINSKFARTDVPRLKAMLVEQVSAATGGPVQYTGRSMADTHRGMQVTEHRGHRLVEVESPETGTSLPDAYQTAPPLAAV